MENQSLIEKMFADILSKIDTIFNQINKTNLDVANHRAEVSQAALHQANQFDLKLIEFERRVNATQATRDAKVDDWFDKIQSEISGDRLALETYKTGLESRLTSIVVKVSAIIGIATVILSALVAGIIRYLLHA